jgi:hypothetical protein
MAESNLLSALSLRLFLPLAVILALALFWQPEREILWNGSWIFKDCLKLQANDASNCIGQYEFSIANTGEKSEHISVEWPMSLNGWSVDRKVLNLSADFKRANDPDYSCNWEAEHAGCSIDNFAPGTLLTITLRCLMCELAELETLDQQRPALISEARVYKSDPRSTFLIRRLGFFISLLI